MTEHGACAEPFYQPEWFETFRATLAETAEALLVTVCDNSTLVGLLPLQVTASFFGRIPARTLRSLSNIHSCRFDLIHDGSRSAMVAHAAWSALKNLSNWQVIEALDVPEGGNFHSLLACAAADGYLVGTWPTRKMPYMRLSNSPDTPFLHCPERFKGSRSKLKSKLKKLDQEGRVTFGLTEQATPDVIHTFLSLEASGWKGANGSAIGMDVNLVDFYTRIAQVSEDTHTLRIYWMALDGRPIAMHFGLMKNGVYYIPKVAYDESYKKYSPGHLLTKYVIEELTREGASRFDFLGPRMEWKCVWTSDYRQHSNCYIFRKGLKGHLLHHLTMGIAPVVRQAKYRWSGDPQEI